MIAMFGPLWAGSGLSPFVPEQCTCLASHIEP